MKRSSTACECGMRRAWPNGPCTNVDCKHFRIKLTWNERIGIALLVLAPLAVLYLLGLWLG